MLTKAARWVFRVKPERSTTPQPSESAIELQPVSNPPPNDSSWPLPNDTSTRPPEDASSPPEREQMSDSVLFTLREEGSASSTHTVVESSASAAAAS